MINAADPHASSATSTCATASATTRTANRHFQPRGLAVTQDNTQLYVTRFLSFTKAGGKQGVDGGKEGLVCRLNINTASTSIAGYIAGAGDPARAAQHRLHRRFQRRRRPPTPTAAFPNQLQSIVLRGNRGYLPNIAASPKGPLKFNVDTQAFLNLITGVGTQHAARPDVSSTCISARAIPEPGKKQAVLRQSLGDGLHHPVGRRQRLCRVCRQRPAGQAQRQRQRHSELHGRRATRRATST